MSKTKTKTSTPPQARTPHGKRAPDVGFRVLTVEDVVDPHDHQHVLWAALLDIGGEKILQEPIWSTEIKVTESKFSTGKDDYAMTYYIGEKTPRYKYVACMSPRIAPSVAMYLLCAPTDAILLRECAMTAEMVDVLRLIHTGLHRSVSVYAYCPPECDTCKERQR